MPVDIHEPAGPPPLSDGRRLSMGTGRAAILPARGLLGAYDERSHGTPGIPAHLRRRWRTVISTALVAILVAALWTLSSPASYRSTLKFFVSSTDQNNSQLAQTGTFTIQRVQSYVQLFDTPSVLQPVIDGLHLGTMPATLARSVTASASANSFIIDVTVDQPSAQQAKSVADGIARQVPKTVDQLETTSGQSTSPIKVTVIQPATVPSSPVSPTPVRNLVLTAVLGVLLGLGLAVLRHTLDTKVRTKSDLDEVSDSTVLGMVPFDPSTGAHPLAAITDPQSPRAEAFRSVRTNLRFVDAAEHLRVFVVTSSVAGEGKTTTTANLALTIAQSGARICVIEADLRRPRLMQSFGMEGAVGLTDLLIGRVELDDVTQRFGRENVFLLGSGAVPPNPSELLGSDGMVEVLRTLREQYDYVIVDAPPLLPVTDAVVLTTMTDGAVMVVGSGIVARDQVRNAQGMLANVNGRLLGTIMNRVAKGGQDRYHYAGTYAKSLPEGHQPQPPRRSSSATVVAEAVPESQVIGDRATSNEDLAPSSWSQNR